MVIPVYCGPIQIPEFPDRNFKAKDAINKRRNSWMRMYPEGHFDVLPNPYEYYEYADIPGKKILFQQIRKSKDASFIEGNYEEELVFFIGEKDYGWFPFQNFHFEKWYKPVFYEWVAGYEIPIELMEKSFNIPFREIWKANNEMRKKRYEQYMEDREAICNTFPFYVM